MELRSCFPTSIIHKKVSIGLHIGRPHSVIVQVEKDPILESTSPQSLNSSHPHSGIRGLINTNVYHRRFDIQATFISAHLAALSFKGQANKHPNHLLRLSKPLARPSARTPQSAPRSNGAYRAGPIEDQPPHEKSRAE